MSIFCYHRSQRSLLRETLLFVFLFLFPRFNSLTHAGAEALVDSLWGLTALVELHLDNNAIADRGAQHLAAVLSTTQISLLNVGFNNIGNAGMISLMQQVAVNRSLQILTLSGNRLELEGGHAVATAAGRNTCLKQLFLDHTELSQVGQCHITTELVSNRHLALDKITGFDLGLVVAQLRIPGLQQHATAAHEYAARATQYSGDAIEGTSPTLPPATIETCSNEIVLQYIRLMWQQPQHQQLETNGYGDPRWVHASGDTMATEKTSAAYRQDDDPRDVVPGGDGGNCAGSDGGFAAAAAAAAASVMMSANSLLRLDHGTKSNCSIADGFLDGLVLDKSEMTTKGNTTALSPREVPGAGAGSGVGGVLDPKEKETGRQGFLVGVQTRDILFAPENILAAKVPFNHGASDTQLLSKLNAIAKVPFDAAELWELHQ